MLVCIRFLSLSLITGQFLPGVVFSWTVVSVTNVVLAVVDALESLLTNMDEYIPSMATQVISSTFVSWLAPLSRVSTVQSNSVSVKLHPWHSAWSRRYWLWLTTPWSHCGQWMLSLQSNVLNAVKHILFPWESFHTKKCTMLITIIFQQHYAVTSPWHLTYLKVKLIWPTSRWNNCQNEWITNSCICYCRFKNDQPKTLCILTKSLIVHSACKITSLEFFEFLKSNHCQEWGGGGVTTPSWICFFP